MARITCDVCGEPTEAGQCKCQSFSEIPLPKKTTPLSTDGAIREGEPPHKPISPTPSAKQIWLTIKCTLTGMVIGMLVMAIYGGIEYSKETAPIPPTELVMLGWAICFGAPIGLFAGIVVGGILSSRNPPGPK